MGELRLAIGLMSGTSMDGIDAAFIRTDGDALLDINFPSVFIPYSNVIRNQIKQVIAGQGDIKALECDITNLHADAVNALLKKNKLTAKEIDIIGFHGHTVAHDPQKKITHQVGDGALLARLTKIDVINDFRSRDIAAGGQGAPLIPVYHKALATTLAKPVAIVNIGGVANVTWVGNDDHMVAFDTGPGNALMDDWVLAHTGQRFDESGKLAAQGIVDQELLSQLLNHSYFKNLPPKSLDRHDFSSGILNHLSIADGLATLVAFTACSIAKAAEHFPMPARCWLITGGGRHNAALMHALRSYIHVPVEPIESIGCDGDMIEAQGFGYLAVRCLLGLAISYPSTTGCPEPMTGGKYYPR